LTIEKHSVTVDSTTFLTESKDINFQNILYNGRTH